MLALLRDLCSTLPSCCLPPAPTMASKLQLLKGRDSTLSKVDVAITTLDLAKDSCGIPPVQVIFGSASALLILIRVLFIPFCDDKLPAHICLGHYGQRTGLCRPWTILHRRVQSPRPRVERETIEWTQPVSGRGSRRIDRVSWTGNMNTEFHLPLPRSQNYGCDSEEDCQGCKTKRVLPTFPREEC